MSDQFVCVSYIDYEDGGSGVMVLHRGDFESCKWVLDATPAVTYTNDKRAVGASLEIMPADVFDAVMKDVLAQRHN